MNFLDTLLGIPSKQDFTNPAQAAQPYMNQIPGVGQQYYNPYIQQGQDASSKLFSEYDSLLNPTKKLQDFESSYQESPGAAYKRDKMQRALDATAAAGGISGNPYHQQQTGELIDNILSQDMQQYLQNAMGLYGQGLQGERDFFTTGYDASKNLSDLLTSNLGSQATLAYKGAEQENEFNQARSNALSKLIAQALGAAGGYMFGVPTI